MKLLITCPRKLLWADSASSDVRLVEGHRPEYYGVSWFADGRHLCLGHSGLENASLGSLQSYMQSEQGWVSFGATAGPRSLSMAHQILCADDRVIATNTGRNCLTVFRTDDWFYRHYWIDQVCWDRMGREDNSGSHFNSIFRHGDQLYVVAHNHDRGSDIVRMSWPEMEVVGIDKTSTYMAHNVWVTDEGQVVVCDSMRGTVVDVATGKVLWKCETRDVVTRGLASDGEYVFIGHSAIGTREARVNRDSRVWVVERSTWKTVDSILLAGSGNVHEIRILDRPDLCHHGHVFQAEIPTFVEDQATVAPADEPLPYDIAASEWAEPSTGRVHAQATSMERDHWDEHVSFARFDANRAIAADFSLATLLGYQATDVTVCADVDLMHATARHAGVVARYQGPADNNMIVALVVKGEGGYCVQLWRQLHGAWSCLESRRIRRGEGKLELSLVGQQATIRFQKQSLITTQIPGPPQSGGVGIRSALGILADFQATTAAGARVELRRRSA